jgi:hypothetical protein
VQIDLARGTASWRLRDVPLADHWTIPNSLGGDPRAPVPATVSFEIEWSGVKRRMGVRDEKEEFVGEVMETGATIAWSATQEGFRFESAPAATSRSEFSALVEERNGVFARAELQARGQDLSAREEFSTRGDSIAARVGNVPADDEALAQKGRTKKGANPH